MSISNLNVRPIALVTGSSSGIGAATAERLARTGWDLVIHARNDSDSLRATRRQIESQGATADVRCCDFSNKNDLVQFCETAWEANGHIDALVNNAGGDVLTGNWAERSFETKLDYLLKTDVNATIILSRWFGARMVSRAKEHGSDHGSHSIVNIGWDQATHGMEGDSGEMFATTKGAIMAVTKSLAQSLAPHVRVNCVAPGWIQTKWGESAPAHWRDRAVRESLMQRWGQPQDVASAVEFFVNRNSSFISGQILSVNGGFNYGQQVQE